MNAIPRHLLGLYAATSGFILMVFELSAARLLAPTIGSSMYVWTSVIGVIVLALSLGFWFGGRLADQRNRPTDIAVLYGFVAISIATTLIVQGGVLQDLSQSTLDARLKAVVASFALFAPTSFVIGVLGPYLAKFNVRSLSASGRSIAQLDALNSIGGITGTFLAGFVLFGYFGVRDILLALVVIALIISWMVMPRWRTKERAGITIGTLLAVAVFQMPSQVISLDTPSGHYTVERIEKPTHTEIHLATGPRASQSGIVEDAPDTLLFWYTQQMAALVDKKKTVDKTPIDTILVLGGGAYTLPQHLAHRYPNTQIDVVEIDPKLIDIARHYFEYSDPANVHSYAVDARTYVNTTKKQYDVVLVDVFGHDQTPFTFVTEEYGAAVRKIVNDDGIIAVNIIGGAKGACRQVFDATVAPYSAHFTHGSYIYRNSADPSGNIMAVFGSRAWSRPMGYDTIDPVDRPLFTDDFAPTERLASTCRST